MTYTYLNLFFLIFIALIVGGLQYHNKIFTKNILINILCTLLMVIALTAIFDSLIIKSGIVAYDLEKILRVHIWKAPIEDFAYAVASVLLTGLLWEYYEKSKK